MVAIDYKQAFNLVNIHLLVDKRKAFGLSETVCDWIRSFLSGRSQVVAAASGEVSSPTERTSGVPQGSPNGPLFFSLFINDAPAVLKHCKYHLYADDFTIYCCGLFTDPCEIIEHMNSDLNHLATWAASNGLVINTRKTFSIWFGS